MLIIVHLCRFELINLLPVSCYRETKKLKDIDVTWPTTPVGKIAYPEQMCLTGNIYF